MLFSLEALKNRNASRLFYGQLISQICDKMMTVGLVWIISKEYSSEMIPWFLAASATPHLALAWFSGNLINRLGPLKTVIAADWGRGLLFISLGLIWPALPPNTWVPALFTVSILSNFAGAVFNPAIMSLPLYAIDEPLIPNVTALLDTCFSLGMVAGPALSALLYPWTGLRGLFLFNGLSYVFAALLESGIRLNAVNDLAVAALKNAPQMGHHFLRVLNQDRLLLLMLAAFLGINLFLGPLAAFIPALVQSEYRGSLQALAQLETSIGLGTVGGGIFLATVRWKAGTGVKILTSMICMSAAYLLFAATQGLLLGSVLLAGLGFSLSLCNVTVVTLFQVRPAPEDVPTVMSLANLIGTASLPVSMTLSAILLQKVELRLLAVVFGVILCLITATTALHTELRRL